MARLLTAFAILLSIWSTALSQGQAAKNGNQVNTRLTVRGNVSAQAVLIPRVNARRIFGAEIANNYAVIEINVGNKSPDAALIIHGIFIDYSRWPLSGNGPASRNIVDGLLREGSVPFQASTVSNQIASEEYRVVRGQLLDAQMWSKRNWTMRLLTLAGSLASAYAFSIGEGGIVRGLNAFSGSVVPGLKEAWPDGTIEQLNRISDFGYQTNKVIPKQGAEVIVCFFPIDRFLTPGFKKLFLKSPALFFSPLQMLADPSMKQDVNKLLGGINRGASVADLAPLLPCYLEISNVLNSGEQRPDFISSGRGTGCESKFGLRAVNPGQTGALYRITDPTKFESLFVTLDFIAQMSLNSVIVTVDGVMSVDTTTIAPSTDGLTWDRLDNCGDADQPCFWTDLKAGNGVRTGTITGSYLTGGNIEIAEAKNLSITDIQTISNGSSDQQVRFSIRLTKPISPDQKLHFVVSKSLSGAAGTSPLNSPPREYRVGYTLDAPDITDLRQKDKKLTVIGLNFNDVPPARPLVVKLVAPDDTEFEVTPDSVSKTREINLTIPEDAAPAGCWKVRVYGGAQFADSTDQNDDLLFFVAPKPVIDSAERKDNQIIVKGEEFIDTRRCNGPRLSFQLKKEGGQPSVATIVSIDSPKRVILNLPAAAKDGKWTVQVLLNGQPVTGSSPVEIK
ncbi:MAG TPA: hypothetical protein VFI24_24070 [Pyrinomonadaceae bacterium]|nr:hypothetical protein [Pyrinomonadaceae bacterium]